MKSYAALLRLQLLSRYADLKPQNLKQQLKEKKAATIGKALGVVILAVYLLVFLVGLETAILKAFEPSGMQDMLVNLAVMMGTLGTLVMAFFFVMSALYFNRDAIQLAALPIRTRTLLSARLTQIWLSETAVNAIILLPAGILYGIHTHVDALYYLRLLFVWLSLSMLPIVVVTWISTLLIRLSSLWKHRDAIATACGIIFLLLYMVFCMNMGAFYGSEGESVDAVTRFMLSQQDRIEGSFTFFPPMRWAARGLLGEWPMLLLFVGVSLAALVLTVWALSRFYRPLTLLQGETNATPVRRVRGDAVWRPHGVLSACCAREWKSMIRVSSYAVNTLPTAIMPLIMIVALWVGFSQTGGKTVSELTAHMDQIPGSLIVGVLAALMGYMMGINPAASTAVTREGRGHDILTSLPIPARTAVTAKLIIGYGISLFGTVLGTALVAALAPAFATYVLLAFALCALYGFATTTLSLARDVKHPRLHWVTEQEAIKQQSGVLIGLLISWGLLVALGIASYFLITAGLSMYLYTAILAALLLGISVFAWLRLMKTADRYYTAA